MIRVGCDCAGIEAPVQALKNLKIKFKHVFSCEIDKYARQSILANYSPEIMYTDIKEPKEFHKLDMYFAGFPCQPFSMSGNRKGKEDPRGTIFEYCLKNIKNTKTTVFVLENVRGILSIDNGKYWEYIVKELLKLKNYVIMYKVLNTKNYGIPQNRDRIYIIGIKKSNYNGSFNFPDPVKMKDIKSFVDRKTTEREKIPVYNKNILEIITKSKATFLNLGWQNFKEHSYENYSPSIIAQATMWCVPLHRRATIKELLALQGFPKNFKQVVSDTQMKKQIGNAMSVNVLEHLIRELMKCVKF